MATKDVAVEFFTLSKSYNMPGWRVGFVVGNPVLVSNALARLKSYFDYGTFTPIQVCSILALEGPQECVQEICCTYRLRRNVLVEGLNKLGWPVALPKATMFVWAQIPEAYKALGSLEFSKQLLAEAKVAVSGHRFRRLWRRPCALCTDRKRRACTRQAAKRHQADVCQEPCYQGPRLPA